jgi:hypothetical protein
MIESKDTQKDRTPLRNVSLVIVAAARFGALTEVEK